MSRIVTTAYLPKRPRKRKAVALGVPVVVTERVCVACYERGRRAAHRLKQRRCQACDHVFTTTRTDARFCSATCRQRAHRHPPEISPAPPP